MLLRTVAIIAPASSWSLLCPLCMAFRCSFGRRLLQTLQMQEMYPCDCEEQEMQSSLAEAARVRGQLDRQREASLRHH